MPNTHQDLTGKVIGTLQVQTIARRQPEIAWHAVCTQCGTQQVQRHAILQSGSAKCANNACGRTPQKESRGSAIAVSEGSRTASSAERREFEQTQRNAPTSLQAQVENLRQQGWTEPEIERFFRDDRHFVHPTVSCWCSQCKSNRGGK